MYNHKSKSNMQQLFYKMKLFQSQLLILNLKRCEYQSKKVCYGHKDHSETVNLLMSSLGNSAQF